MSLTYDEANIIYKKNPFWKQVILISLILLKFINLLLIVCFCVSMSVKRLTKQEGHDDPISLTIYLRYVHAI